MQAHDDSWRPLDQAEQPLVDAVCALRQQVPGQVDAAAKLLTKAGEHGLIWHAIAFAGAAVDRPRRARWRAVNVAVLAAYGANTAVKLAAGRTRPPQAAVGTPTQLSFPSAHAATSAAAATALRGLLPRWLVWPLAIKLPATRLYFAVHYPSDLLGGAVLGRVVGALVARATLRRWQAGAQLTRVQTAMGE